MTEKERFKDFRGVCESERGVSEKCLFMMADVCVSTCQEGERTVRWIYVYQLTYLITYFVF